MVLFHRFPGKVIDHISDKNGHWLIVITEINDENFIFVCVNGYNERGKNRILISDICKHITDGMLAYSTDKIIVGGDFNLVPDLWLDRNPPRAKCHKYDDLVIQLMNSANLIDCWRVKNPRTSSFSWFNASGNGASSRIDYWLISASLLSYINKSVSPLTDHCVISVSFLFSKDNPGPSNIWKFNNTLLENSEFCKDIRHKILDNWGSHHPPAPG